MTIRRRLEIAFLALIVLLAANFGINAWSHHLRSAAMEKLKEAVHLQSLIGVVRQDLDELQKQVNLLRQVRFEPASRDAVSDPVVRPTGQFEAVEAQIRRLAEGSDSQSRNKVEALEKGFQALTASWGIFFENFGVNHGKAVMELAVHADPLGELVLNQLVPQIQEAQNDRVRSATEAFDRTQWVTLMANLSVFAFSLIVGVAVAYRSSRGLVLEMEELKKGAARIEAGEMDQPIPLQNGDELGEVARAFNSMNEQLKTGRTQNSRVNEELERRSRELEKERQVSDSLMLNILPGPVAEEFRNKGSVDPKYFEDVTILFTDFVDFTSFTEKRAAEDLVHMLHEYFGIFDQITSHYGLEKLKTIGDSYMCVGGMPVRNPSHPVDAVMAAFEMLRAVTERSGPDGKFQWSIRIGIHTGPVIAGMVGHQKFQYDIWGESVNYASRMESSGTPNRINLSGQTYSRIKDFFECEARGKVLVKGKKKAEMYFAKGLLQNLVDDFKQVPPPAFLRRYRGYFQKDPPAFPAFLCRVHT